MKRAFAIKALFKCTINTHFLRTKGNYMKSIVISALVALAFTTGFTCSKNQPAPEAAQEQAAPAAPAVEAAPPADAAAPGTPVEAAPAAPAEAAPADAAAPAAH